MSEESSAPANAGFRWVANVPGEKTLEERLPVSPVHHPKWKERTPRDLGASWDFEDVRDHYVRELYGADPARLRSEDPARYLDLARAAPAEVVESVIAEWRRPGSPTAGALVWFWKDLWPGAGWGFLDALGRPKSVFYALRRACRPVQVLLSDEGVNGLQVHTINETAEAVEATLSVACWRDGRAPVARGERNLRLAARSREAVAATELFGGFFDATYAYRFGPPAHDVTIARLLRTDGEDLPAEAFHWLPGRRAQRQPLGLKCVAEHDDQGWLLRIVTDRAAAGVHIVDDGFQAQDAWFDLAPNTERLVRLAPWPGIHEARAPDGHVRAINGVHATHYSCSQPHG